jgi:hypothetical protein
MRIPRLTAPRLRVVVGTGLLAFAGLWRFAGPRSAVVAHHAPFPPVTEADVVTIPVAVAGLALLASAPRLAPWRRVAGVACLITAVLWPTSDNSRSGPVIATISQSHGIHLYDLMALLPALVGGTLLALGRPLLRRARR